MRKCVYSLLCCEPGTSLPSQSLLSVPAGPIGPDDTDLVGNKLATNDIACHTLCGPVSLVLFAKKNILVVFGKFCARGLVALSEPLTAGIVARYLKKTVVYTCLLYTSDAADE